MNLTGTRIEKNVTVEISWEQMLQAIREDCRLVDCVVCDEEVGVWEDVGNHRADWAFMVKSKDSTVVDVLRAIETLEMVYRHKMSKTLY